MLKHTGISTIAFQQTASPVFREVARDHAAQDFSLADKVLLRLSSGMSNSREPFSFETAQYSDPYWSLPIF